MSNTRRALENKKIKRQKTLKRVFHPRNNFFAIKQKFVQPKDLIFMHDKKIYKALEDY
jgi:hypothetical protein